jgi:ATP phosphoribosyltransferase regulatory subunit HisZ
MKIKTLQSGERFMGRAKHYQQEIEGLEEYVKGLVLREGIISECPYHSGIYLSEDYDYTPVFKIIAAEYKSGGLSHFSSQREATDFAKSTIDDVAGEECCSCEKWKHS